MEELNEAKQVVIRLKKAFKVHSDVELASSLDISEQTISTWKSRNSIPFKLCMELANDMNLNLNWLLKGHGSMYINETREESPSYQTKSIHDLEVLFDRVDNLEKQLSEMRKQS